MCFNRFCFLIFSIVLHVSTTGTKYDDTSRKLQLLAHRSQSRKGPIQRKLEKVSFKTCVPTTHQNQDQMLKDFLIKDLENFIAEINCENVSGASGSDAIVPDSTDYTPCTLKNMPVSGVFPRFRR